MQVEVGPKVHQPYGILHGGVSALMAEGAASIGGAVSVGPDEIVVGTELNCSHLRSMSSGTLTATATPVRKGRTVHVLSLIHISSGIITTFTATKSIMKRSHRWNEPVAVTPKRATTAIGTDTKADTPKYSIDNEMPMRCV